MRRVFLFVVLLALAATPLAAQHRGGGFGGGVRVASPGFGVRGGGFVGARSAGHISGGVVIGTHGGVVFGGHFHTGHYYRPRYYYPRYGISFYYGSPSYGSYYPYYPYYYTYPYATYATPTYPVTYPADPPVSEERQQLSQDVNDLRSEVRDLRDSNDQLRYELEKRRMPEEYRYETPPGTPHPQQDTTAPPPRESPLTVLVFKDGKRLETSSYAVAGETLWVLNQKQAHKYPLGMLNVEESRRLNAQRGIEFDVRNK